MNTISLSAQSAVLAVLLIFSGFFSLAETAMMAANRYRLKHLAKTGHVGAGLALTLLSKTDKLLGVILLFNNLINATAATLVSVIAIELFGNEEWALGVGTLLVTFMILVFSEITPKVTGAVYADNLAPLVSFILTPLLRLFYPIVWFINLFVQALLKLFRLKPSASEPQRLSSEELRSLMLEAGHFIPQQHRSILLNLFELEQVAVEDIMVPRGEIEALDLQAPLAEIREQLSTSYHTRLPVYDGDPNNVIGILHQRSLLSPLLAAGLNKEILQQLLTKPYFIPAATPIYAQLQFFQENQQRLGLVVDEYGEIEGLTTLEDILEEVVGKFTTSLPTAITTLVWCKNKEGNECVTLEGSRSLRELNRALGLSFPLTGPKTLNGLILEYFQDIPDPGISVKIAHVPMEILHTQDRMVKTVRLYKPISPLVNVGRLGGGG